MHYSWNGILNLDRNKYHAKNPEKYCGGNVQRSPKPEEEKTLGNLKECSFFFYAACIFFLRITLILNHYVKY